MTSKPNPSVTASPRLPATLTWISTNETVLVRLQ